MRLDLTYEKPKTVGEKIKWRWLSIWGKKCVQTETPNECAEVKNLLAMIHDVLESYRIQQARKCKEALGKIEETERRISDLQRTNPSGLAVRMKMTKEMKRN